MLLYINTTDGETIALALGANGEVVAHATVAAHHQQSELLLAEIDRLLQKGGVDKSDLRGIVVTNGPGKFTATRIGVATANALAYGLQVPVAGVSTEAYDTMEAWIRAGVAALDAHKEQAVMPVYDGEPNISQPKPQGG